MLLPASPTLSQSGFYLRVSFTTTIAIGAGIILFISLGTQYTTSYQDSPVKQALDFQRMAMLNFERRELKIGFPMLFISKDEPFEGLTYEVSLISMRF